MSLRILIAEQQASFRQGVSRILEGHDIVEAASGGAAMSALCESPCSLVITSELLGDVRWQTLMEQARSADPAALVIVTLDDAEAASRVLLSGAHDYVLRTSEDVLVAAALRRVVEQIKLMRENQGLLSSLKRNVEALGLQNRRLEDMAARDGLTGLYNHRYFREALEAELSRCRRYKRVLSLIFADVDFFKNYNDTQGHVAGDALLSTLAKLMTSKSRESTIVARYGGEEFVFLAPETGGRGVLQYAENIRSLVEAHPFEGREAQPGGRITLSLGVATYPEDGTDANALLRHADEALYRAKSSGRNAVGG